MRSVVFPLSPGEREAPLDYVSRLAFRNARNGVRAFCTDFRIGLRALACGEPAAVGAAASLGGADAADLVAMALRPVPGRRVFHCGCEFHALMVSRYQVRLCPACLETDLATGAGRPASRHWRRAEWTLRDIRTCHVHEIALFDLGPQPDPKAADFSRAVFRAVGDGQALAHRFVARAPNGLERYVLRRLDVLDAAPAALLDSLPVHACIRLAEVMGAVALDGPDAPMVGIEDARLSERQAVGFDLAVRGPEGVRDLLDRALSQTGRSSGQRGPQALLGRLYLWLAHPAADASLEPFRTFVRDACLDRIAIGPADAVAPFGSPVETRRLHSVRSASVETGIHRTTLRNVFAAAGVFDASSTLPDDLVTFDAVAHAGLLRDLVDALDLKKAAERLGVYESTLVELVHAGMVAPLLGGIGSAFRHYRFRTAEIDGFVDRLAPRTAEDILSAAPLKSLPDAARSVAYPVAGIASLLLTGRLVRVRRDPGATGLPSVFVDPGEIRAILRPSSVDMAHPKEVRQATGLALHVLRALVRVGLVEGHRVRHPQTGVLRLMVTRDSFDALRRDHVTLVEMAKEAGVSPGRMWRRLSGEGISPATDHRAVGAVVYRRVDVASVDRA